jgi:hypothetical protein
LTSLRAGKTLIAVVNGSFADNHQSELADALRSRGHLLVATPSFVPLRWHPPLATHSLISAPHHLAHSSLAETIGSLAAGAEAALKPFPPADPTAFLRMVDEEAGYA